MDKEIKNAQVDLESKDGGVAYPVGYQGIGCHSIFSIKATALTRKVWLVAGGHTMDTLASMTYAPVLSREIFRVAFLLAALNNLDIFSANVHDDHLNTPTHKKAWF